MTGATADDHLGWSVVGMGDLNGDGCAEVAFGEPEANANGANRRGVVHIVYGWGANTCFTEPQVLSLTIDNSDARFGTSLASDDFDYDGFADLVVGGFNALVAGERRGAAWVIRSSELSGLSPQGLDDTRVYHDVSSMVGLEGEWWVGGPSTLSRFGWSVAADAPYLIVGSPYLSEGSYRSGGATLYELGVNGIERAVGQLRGETNHEEGELGSDVDVFHNGQRGWIGVSSHLGWGTYVQGGSVYIGEFTP